MIKQKFFTVLRRMALAVTLATGSGLASAGVLHVAVDSSNFGAATGYLDLQMTTNAGPLTIAWVNNMSGFDPSADIDAVGVGRTAGGYVFRSDTVGDLFHAVNFGAVLSFDLTFASDSIDPLGLYRSLFLVSAFDEAFAPLGNVDPLNGSLAAFTWTAAPRNGVDGTIGMSITDSAVTVIPEPADSLLMGTGLGLMALVLRRRSRASASRID